MNGVKISLEGIDGVGKTTQLTHVANYLGEQGFDVLVKPCRNNVKSDDVDDELLDAVKESSVLRDNPVAEALIAAARVALVDSNVVNPHLEKGGAVVADRDIDTAVAYSLPDLEEAMPRTGPDKLIEWSLGLYALNHRMPDLTLYLHAEPDVALGRALDDEMPNKRAIFTDLDLSYMRLVQQGYRRMASMFPERIREIDVSDMSVSEVSGSITGYIDVMLGRKS